MLCTIVCQKCVNRRKHLLAACRAVDRDCIDFDDAFLADPENAIEECALREVIEVALAGFRSDQRTIIELAIAGYQREEIRVQAETSLRTVDRVLAKFRVRLQRLLDREES